MQEPSVFIPIPLHEGKIKKRGYNQAKQLAEGLAKRFDVSVVDCLKRVKSTKTQVGLTKEERRKNIEQAFALQGTVSEPLQKYQQVFLVDDVVTSGATLQEAAKVLKKAGFTKVWGVTLAHGE